jgi:hypothetical protein
MTSTGVNLGGGGLVAGVRGTSVAIAKNGTNVTIAIIDSRNSGTSGQTAAATIQRADGTILQTVGSGTLLSFSSGSAPTPTISHPTKTELLTTIGDRKWIRDNTLEDIDRLHTLSGALVANASGELTSTLSGANTPAVATALCSTTNTTDSSSTKVFWPSLVGTIHDPCQQSDIYAFADFKNNGADKNIYFKEDTSKVEPTLVN